MSFSDKIRELRAKKKLSQMKLGELVGIHFTQIGRYERGEATPSAEVLRKLAEAFEVSTDYLMEGSLGEAAQERIQDKELLHQFNRVQALGEEDRKVIKIFLNAFLTKREIQELVK